MILFLQSEPCPVVLRLALLGTSGGARFGLEVP